MNGKCFRFEFEQTIIAKVVIEGWEEEDITDGHTDADETTTPEERLTFGGRAELIRRYVDQHDPDGWAVVDDLPIPVANLVQTISRHGLTSQNVEAIRAGLLALAEREEATG